MCALRIRTVRRLELVSSISPPCLRSSLLPAAAIMEHTNAKSPRIYGVSGSAHRVPVTMEDARDLGVHSPSLPPLGRRWGELDRARKDFGGRRVDCCVQHFVRCPPNVRHHRKPGPTPTPSLPCRNHGNGFLDGDITYCISFRIP